MLNNFLIYLIESSLCFSIMYVLYTYALYRTTYFVWSRWYLILAILISVVIPIIPFPFKLPDNYFNTNLLFISTSEGLGLTIFKSQENSFLGKFNFLFSNSFLNLPNIILAIYVSGLIKYLIIFIRNNIKLIKLIQYSEIKNIGNYKFVYTNEDFLAFSWFKYLFIKTDSEKLCEKEKSHIIEHEKIHIDQHHSLDLMLYDIYGIFFWFNPLVRKSKQTIRNIHEFIVDNLMLKKLDAKEYSNLLVKLSSNTSNLSIVNHFSKNPLIDRIWLMAFPDSNRMLKLRFISGIPIMLIIIMLYSFTVSEINHKANILQFNSQQEFIFPVKGYSQIVSPFFLKKELKDNKKDNKNYRVIISHPEVSISTKSFSKVVATKDGVVTNINTNDNWGVIEISIEIYHDKEFTSVYKGLKYCKVQEHDTVVQSQLIGITGDNRLYPTISYQLLKNAEPINPIQYIK